MKPVLRPAVFLDRDGVINEPLIRDGKPFPPSRLEDFRILPGVEEAFRLLREAGFLLVVTTNQPDVGRGTQRREVVEEMHRRMLQALPLDRVEVCYEAGDGAGSEFRKPAPGMLLRAAKEMGIDLPRSYLVGDRWRDIDCGKAAGCRTVFIDWQYREELKQLPDYRTGNLLDAARLILAQREENRMDSLSRLPIRIFADGADLQGMCDLNRDPLIQGMTTNPTLMKKAGIADYEKFAREVLGVVREKPVSFEVFTDEFAEMKRQARKISHWQDNVYVKIPVTNTRGESSGALIRELGREGVKMNVTALLTARQVESVAAALNPEVPSVVSVFGGRIADTGVDPMPILRESLRLLAAQPKAELLWASVREILNIFQAAQCGCHIVTVPHDLLAKARKTCGVSLEALSLDTVKMFDRDAQTAGYRL